MKVAGKEVLWTLSTWTYSRRGARQMGHDILLDVARVRVNILMGMFAVQFSEGMVFDRSGSKVPKVVVRVIVNQR